MAGLLRAGPKNRFHAAILSAAMILALPPARPISAADHSPPATSSAPAVRFATPAMKPPQKVQFTTDDNLVITGSYWPALSKGQPAPIVICLHMYKHDRSDFEPLVPHLSAAGLAVLAIDLRGHGDSTGPAAMKLADRVDRRDPELFKDMVHDVTAAYEWLRDQPDVDPARFALVGASVGSSVALDYASRDKSVDAVVCLTPGMSYLGINAAEAVAKMGDRQLFLLASEAERAAVDELGRLTPTALTEIVPGPPAGQEHMALHGTRMFGKVTGTEKRIATFLHRSLGEPSNERVVASSKGRVYYPPDSSQARRLSPKNLRWFSSPAEAEARGLRAPASSSKSRSRTGSRSPDRSPAPSFPDGR